MRQLHTDLARISLLLLILFGLNACDKGAPPLSSNDGVTLTISANPSVIKNNGSISTSGTVSTLTVNAIRADGRPVFDDTPVTLTTTGGILASSTITLTGGEGSTNITSGTDIGNIVVTAQSGSVGSDRSINTTIQVVDGQPQIGNLTLVVNPTNLTIRGGVVSINLVVTDAVGNPIPDERVLISSDRGTFENNGAFRRTTIEGVVEEKLTLTDENALPEVVRVTVQVRDRIVSRDITISSNQNPVPVILVSTESIEVGKPVYFEGNASNDPDGTIADEDFIWKFGDGITLTGASVEHTYSSEGTYTVILQVTDNLGASQNTTKVIQVTPLDPNTLPIASFRFSPLQPRTSRSTFFNAQDSNDPDGQILFYQWDFGDGAASTQGPTTSHVYQNAGIVNVTLRVIDNRGGASVSQQEMTVLGNMAPIGGFTTSPQNPRPGSEVTFDCSTTQDPDGSIVSFHIDFGDGGEATSTIPALRHTYANTGTYEVFLTVTDNDGSFGFASGSVNISEIRPPQASFTVAPSGPVVNSPVLFDGSASTSPDGRIERYFWNFGDGGQGTGREVAHTYTTSGTYQVQLNVFDNFNNTDQTVDLVTVSALPVPIAILSVTKTETGTLLLDGSASRDPNDGLESLIFTIEGLAPPGVTLAIPQTSGPIREVQVVSDLTAFQLTFVMRVRNSLGLEASTTQIFNYINTPPATGKRGFSSH